MRLASCGIRSCARGAKTCMLGAGPPRDGIIRTSPGQECSKDKGALPGARRISVYAARFRSATGCKTRVCFKPYHLILHLGEKRVSLCSAKRQSARSSMDRASDYGSEGWGFESLRARSGPPRCDPPVGVLHFYQALLRECFFHAHPSVAFPAGRFPIRSEMTAAQQRAYLSGGATERTWPDRHHCVQNAAYLAHNTPLSAFFAEVVCALATTPA